MTKQLTGKDIEQIVQIIDSLDDVSWSRIVLEIKFHLGRTYTRQALCKYERISSARKLRLNALKTTQHKKPRPSKVSHLTERYEAVKAENARLKHENNLLLEQFARWAKNAYARGIPLAELDDNPIETTLK